MKRILAAILVLLFALSGVSAIGETVSKDIILTPQNPLPEIFEMVSPAVAVVACTTTVWDSKTGHVDTFEEGGGSCVYVDKGGYFITNYHVIAEADEVEIRTEDETAYAAEVVGYDEAADIAVLKIEEEFDAEPVKIGSSSDLKVGEMIAVIGTPVSAEALYNTLTTGIVSGLDRNNADYESTRAIDLIQVDAAINPGNSGGALVNAKGELVGIPFMKYMVYFGETPEGEELIVYEGISFAVPIDTAWPIAQSIIKNGVYNRPRFGVSVLDIDGPEEPLKNYPPKGLQIVEVEKNGSGWKAGLRVNDVITHVNGERVYNFRDYTKFVDKLEAGEAFEITIARYDDENGEKLKKFEVLTLKVVLKMMD
ncbi:MAG: trypsin-like peptidase domain-containing protein [Clostridia bacterium]|nr:trypsin-like peptidase domain-containing protein [Clostridia bacterium]